MSRDMTLESALSDPMIRAMLRADKVEPQAFERLLRSAAGALGGARPSVLPAPYVSRPQRPVFRGFCCA